MAMGLACHGGPSLAPLRRSHAEALRSMWAHFDLVGVTERFDEFLLLLADLVGLVYPAYRSQIATEETLRARAVAQEWTSRECAQLLREPPQPLLHLIRRRGEVSASAAQAFRRQGGRADSHGPPGMMDCAGCAALNFFHLPTSPR